MNPRATSCALYLSMVPSALRLMRKTHFELMMFLLVGRGIVLQVLACSRVLIFLSIAAFQSGQSECERASLTVVGSSLASCAVAIMSGSVSERKAKSSSSVRCEASGSFQSGWNHLDNPGPAPPEDRVFCLCRELAVFEA